MLCPNSVITTNNQVLEQLAVKLALATNQLVFCTDYKDKKQKMKEIQQIVDALNNEHKKIDNLLALVEKYKREGMHHA